MYQKLIKNIKAKFLDRLQKKTNWGRNELITMFNEIVIEVQSELLDEMEKND